MNFQEIKSDLKKIYDKLYSLVGNWTPRAPPGQSNETYLVRLLIISRKQISMLTGWTNVPWGSFGGHLGFRHTDLQKLIISITFEPSDIEAQTIPLFHIS